MFQQSQLLGFSFAVVLFSLVCAAFVDHANPPPPTQTTAAAHEQQIALK